MDAIIRKCADGLETFPGANNTQELLNEVKRRIPIEEDNYKVVDVVGSVDKFKAEIQINIDDTANLFVCIPKVTTKHLKTRHTKQKLHVLPLQAQNQVSRNKRRR